MARGLGFVSAFAFTVYIAHRFGSDRSTDVVFASLYIPQAFAIMTGFFLPAVFVSAFQEIEVSRGSPEARAFGKSAIRVMTLVFGGAALLGMVLSPILARLVAFGFGEEDLSLVARLMKLAFALVLFAGMAAVFRGILNANGKFFLPSLEAAAMNGTALVVVVCMAGRWGPLSIISGLVAGATVKILMMMPSILSLRSKGEGPLIHPALKEVWGQILPLAIVSVLLAIHGTIGRALAARIDTIGAVSHITYAEKIVSVPQEVFGISLGMVLLPGLSRHAASGNMPEFRRFVVLGLRMTAFLGIPAAAGLVVLSGPIVALIYGHGRFDASAAGDTAAVLRTYALTLIFLGNTILSQAFYALRRTGAILWSGMISVIVNIPLSFALVGPMKQSGLTLAFSVATGASFAFSLWLLIRYVGSSGAGALVSGSLRVAACSFLMAGAAWAAGRWMGAHVLIQMAVGAGVYAGVARMLCPEEWSQLRKLWVRRVAHG